MLPPITNAPRRSNRHNQTIAPVPAEDYNGQPHDFSESATLEGAQQVDLTGQGLYDPILGTAHLGILNSPETWQSALDFLTDPSPRRNP
jgi:hypothetical protein